jgi:acetyltransferase-like isoleucine patch superfamily enzyme
MISENAVIYSNVKLGKNCTIEDFAIIGIPVVGTQMGKLETIIGDNALIRSHTVIYAGNSIGKNFQSGNKTNIRESNQIGNDVSIGTLSVIEHHVRIGNGVRIHTQAFIPEFSDLDDECWIGPSVCFTNAKYPKSRMVKQKLMGPIINRSAIIGANSTIMPGITIGKFAFIGAGSVVTADVPEFAVVVGNPARILKDSRALPYEKNAHKEKTL